MELEPAIFNPADRGTHVSIEYGNEVRGQLAVAKAGKRDGC